jgi:hypothetical protein
MFNFRRKIRSASEICLWGSGGTNSGFTEHLTLSIQVEENGEGVHINTTRDFLFFWSTQSSVALIPGDVYSVALSGVRHVKARSNNSGDAFVNCALMSAR